MNSYQLTTCEKEKVVGIHEVDTVISLATQVEALSEKVDILTIPRIALVMHCEGFGGGHSQIDCPITVVSSTPVEQVNFVGNAMRGQSNPFTNIYNPR